MVPSENPNRPTPTRTLVIVGVIGGIVVAFAAFMAGIERDGGQRFTGLARAALGLAILIGGGWAALRRTKRN